MIFYDLVSYYGLHFLRVACLAVGGWIVARVCAKILKQELVLLYKDDLIIDLLAQMARYVILFITGVTILYELNINISGLLGAAGVIGIAVGFAAQTSISNIISGLFLMIEHPFKLGDYIVCEDAEGKVTSINLATPL